MKIYIPFILQVASFTHPSHIVIYAPGIRSLAAALQLEIYWV
ncbi:hypothetical protein PAU_01692 [Photorhabdus asymbiotica]|uniref:Uncharacterized protein n=1 Tax=Photorhabdus asymbiotica subsp. asymbiotica (strain ATCC 43949 / 3105-77) TaxID=553480 RepID=C7BSU0_PHOAA|nr:hypothetical protein PAU_01692 [Photorhabdus asymbiotica]